MKRRVRIVLWGGMGVGKSVFSYRVFLGQFVSFCGPTIEDCFNKTVSWERTEVEVQLLDTGGYTDFSIYFNHYIQNFADVCLLFFSINSRKSFEVAKEMLRDIGGMGFTQETKPIVFVANMCDLEAQREVSREEAVEVAEEWGAPFLEMSAKTGENVMGVFKEGIFQALSPKKRQAKDDDVAVVEKPPKSNCLVC